MAVPKADEMHPQTTQTCPSDKPSHLAVLLQTSIRRDGRTKFNFYTLPSEDLTFESTKRSRYEGTLSPRIDDFLKHVYTLPRPSSTATTVEARIKEEVITFGSGVVKAMVKNYPDLNMHLIVMSDKQTKDLREEWIGWLGASHTACAKLGEGNPLTEAASEECQSAIDDVLTKMQSGFSLHGSQPFGMV